MTQKFTIFVFYFAKCTFSCAVMSYTNNFSFIVTLKIVSLMSRFYDDIEYMLHMRPGLYWQITWRFVSPVIVLVIFVWSLLNLGLNPITYSVWNKKEVPII